MCLSLFTLSLSLVRYPDLLVRLGHDDDPSAPICWVINLGDNPHVLHSLELCLHLGQQWKYNLSQSTQRRGFTLSFSWISWYPFIFPRPLNNLENRLAMLFSFTGSTSDTILRASMAGLPSNGLFKFRMTNILLGFLLSLGIAQLSSELSTDVKSLAWGTGNCAGCNLPSFFSRYSLSGITVTLAPVSVLNVSALIAIQK